MDSSRHGLPNADVMHAMFSEEIISAFIQQKRKIFGLQVTSNPTLRITARSRPRAGRGCPLRKEYAGIVVIAKNQQIYSFARVA